MRLSAIMLLSCAGCSAVPEQNCVLNDEQLTTAMPLIEQALADLADEHVHYSLNALRENRNPLNSSNGRCYVYLNPNLRDLVIPYWTETE